jgi:tetratricopeptide (TPR) repeat protein
MILPVLQRLFSPPATEKSTEAVVASDSDVPRLIDSASTLIQQGHADEALPLLQQAISMQHDSAEAHLMLGTIFHQRQQFEDAQDCYTLARCFRSDWWQIHFHIGLLGLDCSRVEASIASLLKSVELGARDARVHNALGAAYLLRSRISDAREQFEIALTLAPDLAEAHSNLGYLLFRWLEEFDLGSKHIERAVALAPSNITAACNMAMVLQHNGKADEALALCDQLLDADPSLHEVRANRALMLLSRGEFERGWIDYEARKCKPDHHTGPEMPWPEWDGTEPAAKTIFVYAEQGLGDEIMFSSCLPELIASAGGCIVECHQKLQPIFKRSFPRAEIFAKDQWRFTDRSPDCKVAMGSLPRFLRKRTVDYPLHEGYLRADAARAALWRQRLDRLPGKIKVGISWRGGLALTGRIRRSINLNEWLPILQTAGIDFVNLQYSDVRDELDALRAESGIELHTWRDALEDYDETAALVCALDLVISVQTAIVHLTGALGRPVWALIPAMPEWRYGSSGTTMLWYPSARLFRQTMLNDWRPVIDAIRGELQVMLGCLPEHD